MKVVHFCGICVFFAFAALGQENDGKPQTTQANAVQRINDYTPAEQLNIIYSLNKQGRHKEALALIEEIPSPSAAILLEKARAQKALNHTSAAISSYKKTLKKKPDWNVARIELAELHKKKGQTKQALAAYNQVLDNELPYGLRQNLLSSQQTLIQKKQNWYVNFLLNSYYNANINKAPKQGQIYIQGYRFDFDEPIAAYVIAPALKAGYQWDLSPRFAWQIHGASLLEKPVWSDEDIAQKYDKLTLQLQMGPVYKINDNHTAIIQFYGRQHYQNWAEESRILGMQGSYRYDFSPLAFYATHDFSVEDNAFDAFDAYHYDSSLHFVYKQKSDRWNLGLAYRFHEAQNNIHSYQSPMISLVWERDYQYNIRSTFSGFYGFYQYDGYSSLFQSKRQDHELGMFWDIAKSDWRFLNITPHLKYGNINVFSNQDVFERNQHMFSIYGEIDF